MGYVMKKALFVMSILALSLSACSKPTHNATEDIKATAQTQAAASHEAASPTIDSEHNAKNSLDWAGEYKEAIRSPLS